MILGILNENDQRVAVVPQLISKFQKLNFEVWIESQQFKYFNFRREGLVFSTNFNGIYGEQQVTIPYEKIKEHLRDSSMLELIE